MSVAVSCALSPTVEREKLYKRFRSRLVTNPRLNRTLVSFQANRKLPFYRWLKYKEGFSADFVEYAIEELMDSPGVLLDPFAGTGTALFAARKMGWDAIGIELLPVGFFSIEARLAAERVRPKKFVAEVERAKRRNWADGFDPEFRLNHVPITQGAFSARTERSIASYRAFCEGIKDGNLKRMFELACLSVLESVSYTRKDGQYLRWDHRAKKKRLTSNFSKGDIPGFDSAIRDKLQQICQDLSAEKAVTSGLFEDKTEKRRIGTLDLRKGSCLEVLPGIDSESIDMVITSPPYCNRYDYTRTYALELVYLGNDAQQVKALRQEMLSCTVENKSKMEQLRRLYERWEQPHVFNKVVCVFEQQKALQEVLGILRELEGIGRLNNANIPNMVNNYFLEMAFAVCELARVLRRGGKIVMVNDNVRYAGEEIPADLILSDMAERFGLRAKSIWTLARGKGNSSQQMGTHGRSELRKCVYVWGKS
jgi:DNA modification methylase